MDRVFAFYGLFVLAVLFGYAASQPVETPETSATKVDVLKVDNLGDSNERMKRDWGNLKAAWGKRGMDYEVEDSDVPLRALRANNWQGLGAWGKRGDNWGQNLRAWGKRTPDLTDEYWQTLQRQMEAMKSRRAGTGNNWQSLASWGRK